MSYEIDKADMVRSVPTMFATFAGGATPCTRPRITGGLRLSSMNIGFSDAVMEGMQKVIFEEIPEILCEIFRTDRSSL